MTAMMDTVHAYHYAVVVVGNHRLELVGLNSDVGPLLVDQMFPGESMAW
jgi:hypothetical protein